MTYEEEAFNNWLKENTPKEGLSENTKQFLTDCWCNGFVNGFNKLHEENKKLQRACKKWFNKARENKKEILSLEAENAELKKEYSDNLSLKDEELMCLETEFNTFKSETKELIKEYMRFESMIGTCAFYSEEYEKTKKKAEQFLKEIE
jgi:hypothetical protein